MLILTAQIIFWLSAWAIFYVYAGYPLLVFAVSRIFPKPVARAVCEPFVTVLITAYNEEKDIRAKLENTLLIDYPQEKLEITVASDGSTDRTDEIVKSFAAQNVKLFRQEGRVGKTVTQNNAVERANGEIILFSDATTDYQPNVLREMLPNFADQTVGCVAGKLIYVDRSQSNVGGGAKRYWNYETFLKRSESLAGSLIGASGCLYAVRKSAYQPMYAEACSDFLICTIIHRQNLRSVYEPNAVCTEETNQKAAQEMKMRVRVISQTLIDLWRNRDVMNPRRHGFYAVELISHKLFRYSVPIFLVTTLLASGILSFGSTFYRLVFVLQMLFYFSAFAGWILEKFGVKSSVLMIPLYFVLANAASILGFIKFLQGERYSAWDTVRETDNETAAASNQMI